MKQDQDTYPEYKKLKLSFDWKRYLKIITLVSTIFFYAVLFTFYNPLDIAYLEIPKEYPDDYKAIEIEMTKINYLKGILHDIPDNFNEIHLIYNYNYTMGDKQYYQNITVELSLKPTKIENIKGTYRSTSFFDNDGNKEYYSNIDIYFAMQFTLADFLYKYENNTNFIVTIGERLVQFDIVESNETFKIIYDLDTGLLLFHFISSNFNSNSFYHINSENKLIEYVIINSDVS